MRFILLLCFFQFSLLCAHDTYRVHFKNVANEELLDALETYSQLKNLEEHPPSSFFSLKCRAEADIPGLMEVLHSFGYYDAQLELSYEGEFPHISVDISVDCGVCYLFGSIYAEPASILNAGFLELIDQECLSSHLCEPACTQVILHAEDELLSQMNMYSYTLATIVRREVLVDKTAKQVYVTYYIDPGPKCYFGQIIIDGAETVDETYILSKIFWKEGDTFDPLRIKKTENCLQETGLFSLVSIEPATQADENGFLNIYLHVSELKHRHVGAGFSYSTDEKFGFIFQWSHDNFCHRAQELSFVAEASSVVKQAALSYSIPDFCYPNQKIDLIAEAKREDTRGYTERDASLAAVISRQLNPRIFFSYGSSIEKLVSTDSDNNHSYNLFSLPLEFFWDHTNDSYNPSQGIYICYSAVPYQSFLSQNVFFFTQELFSATFFPIIGQDKFILAGCCQFGSISGQSRINIPPPKRFYIGSGDGLRGYTYKTVSPLVGDKPVGGRSYIIFQLEPRIKIAQKLYGVTFFDCGNAYAESIPSFSEKLRKSIGFGFRYLTGLGPLRFDVAFPLDRREGLDSSFQIYANIGQTF